MLGGLCLFFFKQRINVCVSNKTFKNETSYQAHEVITVPPYRSPRFDLLLKLQVFALYITAAIYSKNLFFLGEKCVFRFAAIIHSNS